MVRRWAGMHGGVATHARLGSTNCFDLLASSSMLTDQLLAHGNWDKKLRLLMQYGSLISAALSAKCKMTNRMFRGFQGRSTGCTHTHTKVDNEHWCSLVCATPCWLLEADVTKKERPQLHFASSAPASRGQAREDHTPDKK